MTSRRKKTTSSSGSEELKALHEWVTSLASEDELARAMEFRFEIDDGFNGNSHEYELLSQMVELQAPPPTPVHPRALSFRAATGMGATDGRNEEERVWKDRFNRPRLFQFIERDSVSFSPRIGRSGGGRNNRRQGKQTTSRRLRRFDVIARNFVTPWGELLSVGSTREEQDADDSILKGTGIKRGGDGTSLFGTFKRSFLKGETKSLLRTLRIVSRGKFLSLPFEKTRSGCRSASLSFCAPWFDPTTQFFSLPMYLASRFEVALWSSFRGYQNGVPVAPPENMTLTKLSQGVIECAVFKAIVDCLSTDAVQEASSSTQLRDSLLWSLLDSRWQKQARYQASHVQNLETLSVTSLLELGTKTGKLRHLMQKHLQESLARELESDLIRSLGDDTQTSTSADLSTRKRRSKKKKRKKRRYILPVVHEEKKTSFISTEEASAGEESSDDGIEQVRHRTSLAPAPSPSRARNRTTISVLMLLDEIVESAFERVGLMACDDSSGARTPLLEEPEKKDLQNGSSFVSDSVDSEISAQSDCETELFSSVYGPSRNRDGSSSHIVQPISFSRNTDDALYPKAPQGFGYCDSGLFGITPSDFSFNFNSRRHQNREESLFTDLFLGTEDSVDGAEESLLASSTAASIASSSGIDEYDLVDDEAHVDGVPVFDTHEIESDPEVSVPVEATTMNDDLVVHTDHTNGEILSENRNTVLEYGNTVLESPEMKVKAASETVSPCDSPLQSPSPNAPATPPPQLSPILVSLADLKNLRRRTASGSVEDSASSASKEPSSSAVVAGSLPGSPMLPMLNNGLTPSWSREDLRISSFTDDQHLRRKRQSSKEKLRRNVAATSLNMRVSTKSDKGFRVSKDSSESDLAAVASHKSENGRGTGQGISYAQSEGHQEHRNWSCSSKVQNTEETENITSTKDGSTIISSTVSAQDPNDICALREERNSFRDMCLTLGAEVAVLKNLLAAEKGSKFYPSTYYSDGYTQTVYGHSSYGSGVPPLFQGIPTGISSSRTVAAMSDAGIHRGDQESINVSEDGTDIVGSQDLRAVHLRRMDSATFPDSDASIDHTVTAPSDFRTLNRETFGSVPSHGLHSRLTNDIMNFTHATSLQLRKQSGRRRLATERLSRVITALWPRAQVKLYGSHVSGNCLPSSDLDFVICLPAVHKNAPAVAPGVLEGMNAINETSQKLLARKLKGESWIDPNSIKIVERTAVPVIKVSTKDSRSRMLQLDISFDGPEHSGLPAIDLVKTIMQELPMIQPLILVLKQFLLDRGLLTAFTGGLSSYCLFLMIARYLQEQPSSLGDCGSLLMGFLDFYGNSFDPRATGVSVSRRQYFSRLNCSPVSPYPPDPQMWSMPHTPHVVPSLGPPLADSPEFLRRHSFSDKAGNTGKDESSSPPALSGMRPPRFQQPSSSSPRKISHHVSQNEEQELHAPYDHVGKPYTYDPLFVEDPLCPGNNVGRNAFRIYQVQRAFSDAHRALVASLEWDIYSTNDLHDGVDYPLLKCLLQSEDVFYELEDPK